MIHTIFAYSNNSGLLMWEKSFGNATSNNTIMFSSFFTAIKAFIQEMVLKGNTELKNIEMGNYIVTISGIKEIGVDLVIIADINDRKRLSKLIPQISKIFMENKKIFVKWSGNRRDFEKLNEPIMKLIKKAKGLNENTTSIFENQSEVLKSIWEKKDSKEHLEQKKIEEERDSLYKTLKTLSLLPKKIEIIQKIIELDENLQDDSKFLADQKLKIKFEKEFADIKLKLDYFLSESKKNLSKELENSKLVKITNLNFRSAYLSMYSFAGKLKQLGKDNVASIYKNVANILIDREKYTDKELSETISYILKLPDDIEYYIAD